VRGNHHAKAGIEAAAWDAMAKETTCGWSIFAAHFPGHPNPMRRQLWRQHRDSAEA
jgi:hypothetical protein